MDRYNSAASAAGELLPVRRQQQLFTAAQNGFCNASPQLFAVRDNSVFQSTPNLATVSMDNNNQFGVNQPYLHSGSYQHPHEGVITLHPPSPNRDGSLSPRKIM